MSEITDRKALANKLGIAGADEMGAAKLFKALKEKLGSKSIVDAIADHKAGKSVDQITGKASSSSTSSSTPAKTEDKKVTEEIKSEVLAPISKLEHSFEVHAPQIHNHIAPPKFDWLHKDAPRWHEITGVLWDKASTMVVGAAIYALASTWAPHLIHLASAQ